MNPFSADELERLAAQFPQRNVDRVAQDCARKHALTPFRNPLAMLTKWLETAEAHDTNRRDELAPPPAQGRFHRDGSWDPKGYGDPAMHCFVDMLVTARRRGYTPTQIATRILRDPMAPAFPNAPSWLNAGEWSTCPTATSAEQCVKDEGRGSGRPQSFAEILP